MPLTAHRQVALFPAWAVACCVALGFAPVACARGDSTRAGDAKAAVQAVDASTPAPADVASAKAAHPNVTDASPASPASGASRAGAACNADAGAAGLAACDLSTQACIGGQCVDCPNGTAAMSDACERLCSQDSQCKAGEICSYLSPAYSFCTPKPPVPTCPAGQIALKTGTCFRPCKSDKDCAVEGPGMCCVSDPNAPTTICMGKCL